MKRFLFAFLIMTGSAAYLQAAFPVTGYVQVDPPNAPQPGGFNTQTGTVGQFTDTGLAPNQCVQTGPGGILQTSGNQCSASGGGGGTSSLETMVNTVHLSSPTPTINIIGQGVVGSLAGSTATITLPFAAVATATTTIAANSLTTSSATATYLSQSNAAATYLTQSSATANYLQIAPAANTYLTQSSATVSYCHANGAGCTNPATTLTGDITGSGTGSIATTASAIQGNIRTITSSLTVTGAGGLNVAGAGGVTIASIASGLQCVHADASGHLSGTGLDCSGTGNFVNNSSVLQSGATFYVSSGTIAGTLNIIPSASAGIGNLNITNGAIVSSNTNNLQNIVESNINGLITTTGDTATGIAISGQSTGYGSKANILVGTYGESLGTIQSTGTAYGLYGYSIATGGQDIGVYAHANGGTSNHAVLIDSGDFVSSGTAGTSGQVFTSNGAGLMPEWKTSSGSGGGVVVPGTFTWTNNYGISISTISAVAPNNTNVITSSVTQSGTGPTIAAIQLYCNSTGSNFGSCSGANSTVTSSGAINGIGYNSTCTGSGKCYGISGTVQGTGSNNYGGYYVAQSATTNDAGYFFASGGTNNHAIEFGQGDLYVSGSAGTNGQVLTSGGPNAIPSWTTPTGGSGTSTLEVMGNSVRITSPTATLSLLAASNITLTTAAVSGTTAQITISSVLQSSGIAFGTSANTVTSDTASFAWSENNSALTVQSGTAMSLAGYTTGQNMSNAGFVVANQHYAYMTASGGNSLSIFDISVASNPFLISQLTTMTVSGLWGAEGLELSSNYLYVVTASSNALIIFDVSSPASPKVISQTIDNTNLAGAEHIRIIGNYAYIANDNSTPGSTPGVAVWDISNPSIPIYVAGVINSNIKTPVSLTIRYPYLYQSNKDSSCDINVIDISNPLNPLLKKTFTPTGCNQFLIDTALYGKYLYATSPGMNAFYTVDISSPLAPVSVSSYSVTFSQFIADKVVGNSLFMTEQGNHALWQFSLVTPSSPTFMNKFTDNVRMVSPDDLIASGSYLIVTTHGSGSGGGITIINPGAINTTALTAGSIGANELEVSDDIQTNRLFVNAGFMSKTGWVQNQFDANSVVASTITASSVTLTNLTVTGTCTGCGGGGGSGYAVQPATVTFNLAKGVIITTVTVSSNTVLGTGTTFYQDGLAVIGGGIFRVGTNYLFVNGANGVGINKSPGQALDVSGSIFGDTRFVGPYFESNANGAGAGLGLDSPGSFNGVVETMSRGVWDLGYTGGSYTSLDTPVLKWDVSPAVTVLSSMTVQGAKGLNVTYNVTAGSATIGSQVTPSTYTTTSGKPYSIIDGVVFSENKDYPGSVGQTESSFWPSYSSTASTFSILANSLDIMANPTQTQCLVNVLDKNGVNRFSVNTTGNTTMTGQAIMTAGFNATGGQAIMGGVVGNTQTAIISSTNTDTSPSNGNISGLVLQNNSPTNGNYTPIIWNNAFPATDGEIDVVHNNALGHFGGSNRSARMIFSVSDAADGFIGQRLVLDEQGNTQVRGSLTVVSSTTLTGLIVSSGTAPVLSSCGTSPSLSTGSSNFSGTITGGSAATGCTLTFASGGFINTPTCVISNQSMSITNALTYTVSTTALTLSETAFGTSKVDYICIGH